MAAAFPLLILLKVTCLLAKKRDVLSWEGGPGGGVAEREVGRDRDLPEPCVWPSSLACRPLSFHPPS